MDGYLAPSPAAGRPPPAPPHPPPLTPQTSLLEGHPNGATAVAWSLDGGVVATGAARGAYSLCVRVHVRVRMCAFACFDGCR